MCQNLTIFRSDCIWIGNCQNLTVFSAMEEPISFILYEQRIEIPLDQLRSPKTTAKIYEVVLMYNGGRICKAHERTAELLGLSISTVREHIQRSYKDHDKNKITRQSNHLVTSDGQGCGSH